MPSQAYMERKKAYIKRYQIEKYTNLSFKVRTERDVDVLDKLASVPNKSQYIIALIRKDIKRTAKSAKAAG